MFIDFFEELKDTLAGIGANVKVGLPHEGKIAQVDDDTEPGDTVTIYLTFVNIESINHVDNHAKIRVLLTAFIAKEELDDEDLQIEALRVLGEIIVYLKENKRIYNLIATPESMLNNIWSAFKIPLRPFLMYECPINLSLN